MSDLVSMQLSKAERKAKEAEYASSMSDVSEYPYGLRLTLDSESLAKLGVKSLPAVGGKMMLNAEVTITSVSQHESQQHENKSVELQITDMALAAPSKATSDVMYGGSKN